MRRCSPDARLITSVRTLRHFSAWLSSNIFVMWSMVDFATRVCLTDHPELSLSASCAEIQALAYKSRAIRIPPGDPAEMFPPRYQGLSTQSKECSNAVRGRADSETRYDE